MEFFRSAIRQNTVSCLVSERNSILGILPRVLFKWWEFFADPFCMMLFYAIMPKKSRIKNRFCPKKSKESGELLFGMKRKISNANFTKIQKHTKWNFRNILCALRFFVNFVSEISIPLASLPEISRGSGPFLPIFLR